MRVGWEMAVEGGGGGKGRRSPYGARLSTTAGSLDPKRTLTKMCRVIREESKCGRGVAMSAGQGKR